MKLSDNIADVEQLFNTVDDHRKTLDCFWNMWCHVAGFEPDDFFVDPEAPTVFHGDDAITLDTSFRLLLFLELLFD